ncbi:cytochrome P450 [Kroppenstedtia pulmonis]|uniref:Cytochrome P450 n=1 Tax=Kroppenstedtia pulmonis TaxID=1380685 RepID=A0A7D3XHX3_9BACL|nr:cytochrome P450 [Kroppenstedtia pulmonis]QKG83519.1 cytochrome P450 [Kroppenstedtia pulmonis]
MTETQTKIPGNVVTMKELDSREQKLNPFPVYRQLRENTPVRFDPDRQCWDFFRYEDVRHILRDPESFSSKRTFSANQQGSIISESLITTDPPKHRELRSLISKAFTPKRVEQLGPSIQQIVDDLLEQVLDQGRMEVVSDLASPLPVIVIARLLGVPREDQLLFKKWSDTIVKGEEGESREAVRSILLEKQQAETELVTYFRKIIAERSRHPQNDLISALLAAEVEGEKLSESTLLAFCVLLLIAGNETTTNLITNGIRLLTEKPDLQRHLREKATLIPGFIEETLRYYPPVQSLTRTATTSLNIRGNKVGKGEMVIIYLASANRDSEQFLEPDMFQMERKPNPHLSFGLGNHFCLGAPLARLESKIVFESLFKHIKGMKAMAHDQMQPLPSPVVFGLQSYPITLET